MNAIIVEGYLLDTSVASAVFDKGNPYHSAVRNNLEQLGEGIVYICPISIGEVEYGLKAAPSIDACFGEIGRLFGMKPAGCSVKSATPAVARDWGKFNLVYRHFQSPPFSQFL